MAIVMLVLTPSALLLASATSTSGEAQHQVTALSIASSYLDEVQALQSPTAPGGDTAPFASNVDPTVPYNQYLGVCGGTTTCVSWPATPTGRNATFPTQRVGDLTYALTAAGGWCQEVTVASVAAWVQPGAAGTPTHTQYQPSPQVAPVTVNVYSYWVVVKVSWGNGGNSDSGHIVQHVLLTPQSAWPSLQALTNGINPSPGAGQTPMCPMGLS